MDLGELRLGAVFLACCRDDAGVLDPGIGQYAFIGGDRAIIGIRGTGGKPSFVYRKHKKKSNYKT